MNSDLKKIKKHYGEKMMHLCRELFSEHLETEGLLYNVMDKYFSHNRFLSSDIISQNKISEFKIYIDTLLKTQDSEIIDVKETPFELLDKAGYILYECKTQGDIQYFNKYYKSDELLCTFNEKRLEKAYVFFAVIKDINKIRREDFKKPFRGDLYSKSIIGIQFSKGKYNNVAIKNRYNTKIDDIECVFGNDLDNIIPNLTRAFEQYYGYRIINRYKSFDLELVGYHKHIDNKMYKYNVNDAGTYYGINNVIITNENIFCYDYEKYIIFEKYILSLENKYICRFDNKEDSFTKSIKDIVKISVYNEVDVKRVVISVKDGFDVILELDNHNKLISYTNYNIVVLENSFMFDMINLKKLIVPNVYAIENYALQFNEVLEEIDIKNVVDIGNSCFIYNKCLKELNIPYAQNIGSSFFLMNSVLDKINVFSLKSIGSYSFDNVDNPSQVIGNINISKNNTRILK